MFFLQKKTEKSWQTCVAGVRRPRCLPQQIHPQASKVAGFMPATYHAEATANFVGGAITLETLSRIAFRGNPDRRTSNFAVSDIRPLASSIKSKV